MSGGAMDRVLCAYPAGTKGEMRCKLVLLAVASYAVDGRFSHPGIAALTERAQCDGGVVRRCLDSLLKGGWLSIVEVGGGRGRATKYELAARIRVEDKPARKSEKRARKGAEMEGPHNSLTNNDQQSKQPEPLLAVVLPMPSDRMFDLPDIPQLVFDEWRRTTGRTVGRYKLNAERRKKIEARVKEDDFELDDLLDAVRGIMRSEWHVENNQTELTTIMRSASQVEKFRDLWRRPVPAKPGNSAIGTVNRQAANVERNMDLVTSRLGLTRRGNV